MQDKNDQKIYIRKCIKPETKAREIYDAWGINTNPGFENMCYPKNNIEKRMTLITWKLQVKCCKLG